MNIKYFIILVCLLCNIVYGQVNPQYYNYSSPNVSRGKVYHHNLNNAKQSVISESTYSNSYSNRNYEPETCLGAYFSDIYARYNGKLKFVGKEDGEEIFVTEDQSQDPDVSVVFFYNFKNNKVTAFTSVITCDPTLATASNMYYYYLDEFKKYTSQYVYSDPYTNAVVYCFKNFGIGLQCILNDDNEAEFSMIVSYY